MIFLLFIIGYGGAPGCGPTPTYNSGPGFWSGINFIYLFICIDVLSFVHIIK